ncbi:MAG: FtsX-like permease family protein [Acidobacteriota bacterium]
MAGGRPGGRAHDLATTGRPDAVVGEIIGVVGGVHWGGLAAPRQGTTYFWLPQRPDRRLTIVARTMGDPGISAPVVASEVARIDPDQPVADVRAMRDYVADDLARPRFTMFVLASFALAALLLAAVGVYGVIAFAVSLRTREIGVRVALGASYRDVLGLVMGRALRLAASGLAVGIAAALALGPVLEGLLFGVSPTDPTTLVGVAVVLAAVAMLAAYAPARRAARVSPMMALKSE